MSLVGLLLAAGLPCARMFETYDPPPLPSPHCNDTLPERQFSRDLAFALWLPLVLAAFVARSCDAPGAGPAACEKGKVCGLALSSFPCGAHAARQVRLSFGWRATW